MPSASGKSFGEAIRAMVQPPSRTVKQQINYLLSRRTGASVESVAKQLGVKQATVRGWVSGKTAPSAKSRGEIEALYGRFYQINTRRAGDYRAAKLKITNTSNPNGIQIQGRTVNPVEVERDTRRRWDRVAGSRTADEAARWFKVDILGPSPLPPVDDYLVFDESDAYLIEW